MFSQSKLEKNFLTSVENANISNNNSSESFRSEIAIVNIKNNPKSDRLVCEKSCMDFLNSPFYKALAPLMFCLKLSGLYFIRPANAVITPQMVYCYILSLVPLVGLAMVASIFRLTTAIDVNFMTLLSCFSYALLCIVNAFSFLKNAHDPKEVRKFFIGLDKLNNYGGPLVQATQINKLAKYVVAVSCVIYCFTVCVLIYAIFRTEVLYVVLKGFGLEPTNPIIQTVMAVFVSFLVLQWVFPNSIELCFAMHLYKEYRQFYKIFTKRIRANHSQLQEFIEDDRRRFVQMARIVEAADKVLGLHHGASFASNLANLCLELYMIAYYSSSAQVSIFIALLLLFMADIVIICVSGILINTAVSR